MRKIAQTVVLSLGIVVVAGVEGCAKRVSNCDCDAGAALGYIPRPPSLVIGIDILDERN